MGQTAGDLSWRECEMRVAGKGLGGLAETGGGSKTWLMSKGQGTGETQELVEMKGMAGCKMAMRGPGIWLA